MAASAIIEATLVPEPSAEQQERMWRSSRRAHHRTSLILATLVLAASLTLSVRGERQVVVPVVNWALPGVCYWKQLWDLDCPGCGMTRCFISAAHGDLPRAWQFNSAGLLLFGGLLFQFPYRAVQLRRLAHGREEMRLGSPVVIAWVLFAAIIGQWLIRMAA